MKSPLHAASRGLAGVKTWACLWPAAASPPGLNTKDVHVWCADLDHPGWRRNRISQALSSDEWTRAARYYFDRDRNRYVIARAILRDILGTYLDQCPESLRFEYTESGKPLLAQGSGALEFNVSHSEGLGLFAISQVQVGVDVERVRPVPGLEGIARRFFSGVEMRALSAIPAAEQEHAFLRGWTRKEAYAKATGTGLTDHLDQFDVSLLPAYRGTLLGDRMDAQATRRWSLSDLRPATGYIAAVAARDPQARLKCWQWIPRREGVT